MNKAVLDLRKCEEGVSCEEFTTLMVAGLSGMPPEMRCRMNQHERACSYHQSPAFHQSALGIYVTPEIEQAARDIVKKYTEKGSSI